MGKALSFVTLSMTNLIMYISLFLYAITALLLKINKIVYSRDMWAQEKNLRPDHYYDMVTPETKV